jgi:hypothetical protein
MITPRMLLDAVVLGALVAASWAAVAHIWRHHDTGLAILVGMLLAGKAWAAWRELAKQIK